MSGTTPAVTTSAPSAAETTTATTTPTTATPHSSEEKTCKETLKEKNLFGGKQKFLSLGTRSLTYKLDPHSIGKDH